MTLYSVTDRLIGSEDIVARMGCRGTAAAAGWLPTGSKWRMDIVQALTEEAEYVARTVQGRAAAEQRGVKRCR